MCRDAHIQSTPRMISPKAAQHYMPSFFAGSPYLGCSPSPIRPANASRTPTTASTRIAKSPERQSTITNSHESIRRSTTPRIYSTSSVATLQPISHDPSRRIDSERDSILATTTSSFPHSHHASRLRRNAHDQTPSIQSVRPPYHSMRQSAHATRPHPCTSAATGAYMQLSEPAERTRSRPYTPERPSSQSNDPDTVPAHPNDSGNTNAHALDSVGTPHLLHMDQ